VKIRSLEVENFRVVKAATVRDLPMVTGIWGRNGTGKSALLQSVVVLRNWFRNPGINQTPPSQLNVGGLRLGQLEDVVWKGGAEGDQFRVQCEFDPTGKAVLVWGARTGLSQSQQDMDPQAIRYFPPHRFLTNRVSSVSQTATGDLGENTSAIHQFVHWFHHRKVREQQLSGKKNEVDSVDGWLTRVGFGRTSDREERRYGQGQVSAVFADSKTSYETPFIDGGYGGVNFAPLVLEAYSYRNGILLIEEPEISLHPGAQAEVFDFMVEMARERNHQILFTSHSEYLLARFARHTIENGPDDKLLGVLRASKDQGGAHFERESLANLSQRFEKQQNLLSDLHTRSP
jgi:hypothetical protein